MYYIKVAYRFQLFYVEKLRSEDNTFASHCVCSSSCTVTVYLVQMKIGITRSRVSSMNLIEVSHIEYICKPHAQWCAN